MFEDIKDNCLDFKSTSGAVGSIGKYYQDGSTTLDLSKCIPKKLPPEINAPDDVYAFTEFCNNRTDECYSGSGLANIPVSTYTVLTAKYTVNRGKVIIDINAEGGYFSDGFSVNQDNKSYVIYTQRDGTFVVPSSNTAIYPGNIFQRWLLNGAPVTIGDTLTYTDYNSDLEEGINIFAEWLGVENCCSVKFRNPNDETINRFMTNLTNEGKLPYGTQIALPDWYDTTDEDWGGVGGSETRKALQHWRLYKDTAPGTLVDTPTPGTIFTVQDNVSFTAVLDSAVTGISKSAELKAIAGNEVYRLVDDIALEGDWSPISGFTGTLYGGGKTISGLSFSTAPVQTTIGFFSELGGKVNNLTLEVANGGITYTSLGSDVYYGVFAGKLISGGELLNVTAKESISVTVTGFTARDAKWDVYAGGLAGSVEGGSIANSSSRVDVTASNRTGSATLGAANPFAHAGGIAGTIKSGSLTNVYSAGNILATSYVQGTIAMTDDTDSYAGGIVGLQTGGNITYSYAYGNIIANAVSPDTPTAYAGGIAGAIRAGTINNSLGINEVINAVSTHPNGNSRGTKVVGRVAADARLTAANNGKIYGNERLDFTGGTTIWNGANRSYYFHDLSWFWDPGTIAFKRGITDSTPWIEDEYYKYFCPLTMCPIFYWER
jgi:hypothetical protein